MLELNGKKILIIGASKGIGEVIARSLIKNKANVITASRNKPNYDSDYYKLDITKEDSIKSLKNYIESNYHNLDGIVFVAGKSIPAKNKDKNDKISLQDPTIFYELIYTNLISIYNCMFNFQNLIKEKGSIVFISSIGAHRAFPNNTGYQVSKAGLESMTRSIAYELGPKNIRANTIILGYFKTKMTIKSYNIKELQRERSNRTILNRWGDPDEVTGAANFLLSEKSSYMTGSSITIDGGWLAKGL